MDSVALQVLVFWPGVVLLSAALSMLTYWRFSWSELVLVTLVGCLLGLGFFAGTEPNASGLAKFALVFTHGLWGLLFLTHTITTRTELFWFAAGSTVAVALVGGLLDRLTLAIGKSGNVGGFILSLLLILPMKVPFALFTTGAGLLFFVAGIFRQFGKDSGIGLNGGMLFIEWDTSGSGPSATTLGTTIQVWTTTIDQVIEHELYHSRQYVFLRDLMIPTWLVGGIWGLISSAIDGSFSLEAFSSAKHDKEVGNPMEVVGYQINGFSNF